MMENDFYPIPLSFRTLMKKRGATTGPDNTWIDKVGVEQSVYQNVSLYLSTRPGEYYFDETYGCAVHHYDFRQLSDTQSKNQLKQGIAEYLAHCETRIQVQQVAVEISDVQEVKDGNDARMCRYITVTVGGQLISTQEKLPDMKFTLIRYS